MIKILIFLAVIMGGVVTVSAQNQRDLKRQVEGRRVTKGRVTSGVVQLGPRTTYLKEGLSTEDVLRVLGRPAAVSERKENDLVVTTYEFSRSGGRVLVAEFVGGTLVRSRTETRPEVSSADY